MSIKKITPQIAGMMIGQKADLFWDGEFDRVGILVEVQRETLDANGLGFDCDGMGLLFYPYSDVKFHLRSPDTLTEQECQMLYHIETWETWFDHYGGEENALSCIRFWFQDEYKGPTGSPLVWLKMLEMGFDLFGLITAGLAKEIGDGK